MSVPTPTGVLQGVAAFNWDGAAWQPAGRAGPSVPTPTGNLQGVAAFSGVPPQPTGRSGPGVATPTGVLDGVAVYTWSGSQWTPSTPSGALRGVAAFDWDGSAWQPAGQAGPDVPTPYGVLQGVARFGWTGSAWAAVGAPSLSLDFMTPNQLDSRVTFTRASPATYEDSAGVIRTAAANAPRWNYAGGSLRGLLIEEARTNLALQSSNMTDAVWGTTNGGGPVVPVVTGNQPGAPDGTATASRIVFPAVSVASSYSVLYQPITTTNAAHIWSIWLKGAAGGEQIYIGNLAGGGALCTLTTQWQRFRYLTVVLAAGNNFFTIGADLRGGQGSISGGTVYAFGAQVELGAFATSYVATAAASVTRAPDQCYIPVSTWFDPANYSLFAEFDPAVVTSIVCGIGDTTIPNASYIGNQAFVRSGAGSPAFGSSSITAGAVNKQCAAITPATLRLSNNGTAPGSAANGQASQTTATRLSIGMSPWGLDTEINGHMRRLTYWNRALSDAEMRQVTA